MLRDAGETGGAGAPSVAPSDGEGTIEIDDRDLVAACLAGDEDAFEHLVERHQVPIYRLCFRCARDHADAADLAQEAFLRAHRGLSRFRGDSSFGTWLYRIALNVARTHVTRRRESLPLTDANAVEGPSSLERVEREQQMERVRAAVARLPEKQRATLVLKVYQELTHEEVARIMGTSVGTTKANLFHALANLRRMLRGAGGES